MSSATNLIIASSSPAGDGARGKNWSLPRFLVFLLIGAAIIGVRLRVSPVDLADFDTYLVLADELGFMVWRDVLSFEPLSSAAIALLRDWSGSSYAAISIAHWLLSIGFLVGFYITFRLHDTDWRGVLVIFALYGALLSLITIRATPAYILVALATVYGMRGRPIAILLTIVAAGFHASAGLAIIPIVALVLQNRIGFISDLFRNDIFTIGASLIVFIFFVVFYDAIILFLLRTVSGFTSLTKYMTYLSAADQTLTPTVSSESQVGHIAYRFACSGLVLFFLLQRNEESKRLRSYVILSFAVFAFLSFSPVSAYRQSIFWTVPLLMNLPWRRYSFANIGSTLIVLGSVAVGAIGFYSVQL